jgi:hypothetical protein
MKTATSITVATGNGNFSLCFLTAANLDALSLFLAEAAQQLRYCTKNK